MKATIWKAYYRMTMGREVADKAMANASLMVINLEGSTAGKISHFYNNNTGEQIRGWTKRKYSSSTTNQHPLITKYN